MTYCIQISTISRVNNNRNPSFWKLVEAANYAAACKKVMSRYRQQVVIHCGYRVEA